jgi:hypothetical protein
VIEALELEFEVECSPEHAFEVWTARISQWWPRGHSVSADPELAVVIEPRLGGRIYERTSTGVEHDWGEVTTWEPPHVFGYLWHIARDRSDASEVEVRFNGEAGHTKVSIVHDGWERLGALGPELRSKNRNGWVGVIPRYERACAG